MKHIIFLVLILMSLNNYSQENEHNFILNEDNTVLWQKVFLLEGTEIELKEKLIPFLKNQKFTTELEYSGSEFRGKSTTTNIKNSTDFTCFIIIELKENKYRVTIKDIIFEPINSGVNYGGIVSTSSKSYSFEYYVVNVEKNEFKNNKRTKDSLKSFDFDFDKFFTYKKPEKSSDW